MCVNTGALDMVLNVSGSEEESDDNPRRKWSPLWTNGKHI